MATAAAPNPTEQSILSNKLRNVLSMSPRLFAKPQKSEDSLLRPMLNNVFVLLEGQDTKFVQESQVRDIFQANGGFVLSSKNSQPEPAIMHASWVLVASEANGVDASAFVGLAQGCQCAGDGALLLRKAGLAVENCVVPGVLIYADCLQFYAAFLLPDHYPGFCFLSSPIVFGSRQGRSEIAAWLLALRQHTTAMVELLKAPGLTITTAAESRWAFAMPISTPTPFVPQLDATLFFKPIRLLKFPRDLPRQEDLHPYRIAISETLEIYQRFYQSESCRQFVNFSIGWMQMPPAKEQPNLVKNLTARVLEDRFKEIQLWQPYLVFERLEMQTELHDDELHIDLYIKELKSALFCFEEAEVVHFDLRPQNIMWTCSCKSVQTKKQKCDEGEEKHVLQFKVIDWEESYCKGDIVPGFVVNAQKSDTFRRYPLSHASIHTENVIASTWVDKWAAKMIQLYLQSKCLVSWPVFMQQHEVDLEVDLLLEVC